MLLNDAYTASNCCTIKNIASNCDPDGVGHIAMLAAGDTSRNTLHKAGKRLQPDKVIKCRADHTEKTQAKIAKNE